MLGQDSHLCVGGTFRLAPQCQFTSADRDDLPPRRTKTLMALPDTHPYFVVLSHSCVALSRLCCDTWSSFLFNYEAVCSFELGALRLASPVALDVSACFSPVLSLPFHTGKLRSSSELARQLLVAPSWGSCSPAGLVSCWDTESTSEPSGTPVAPTGVRL